MKYEEGTFGCRVPFRGSGLGVLANVGPFEFPVRVLNWYPAAYWSERGGLVDCAVFILRRNDA